MVGVIVRDEHVVDLRDAGVVHGCQNAVGVAAIVAGPAGIHEQRRAGWGHEQRGLPAFHVDGVDEQVLRLGLRPGGLRRGGKDHRKRAESEQKSSGAAG